MKKIAKEYQDKTLKELESEERKLREEIAKTKLEKKAAKQKDTNLLGKKRQRLAVVLTLKTIKSEMEKLKVHPLKRGQQ